MKKLLKNVKKLLAKNRFDIWKFSDSNENFTRNHLFRKRLLNHVAEPVKLSVCAVSTYLSDAIDCVFLSSQIRIKAVCFYHVAYVFRVRSSLTFWQLHGVDSL